MCKTISRNIFVYTVENFRTCVIYVQKLLVCIMVSSNINVCILENVHTHAICVRSHLDSVVI